jgi:hypothetical protein
MRGYAPRARGRGDPCTQCEAQSWAQRATLLSRAMAGWRADRSQLAFFANQALERLKYARTFVDR